MIESISIASEASYGAAPEVMGALAEINFVYGANGAGKTTISRIIAEEGNFTHCSVSWSRGTRLDALVYNSDYVQSNFVQSPLIKGVFTLGEKDAATLGKIQAAKDSLRDLMDKRGRLRSNLEGEDGSGGKRKELNNLETSFKERCWTSKASFEGEFKPALEGFRGSMERFKEKVVSEKESNTSDLVDLATLQSKAKTLFSPAPAPIDLITRLSGEKLGAHESNSILGKNVVGREDVDISAMIKKLGNSDWVRQGRAFYDKNDGDCPFCQQSTPEAFGKSLSEYFDESFDRDSKAINDLVSAYNNDASDILSMISKVISAPPTGLNKDRLGAQKAVLESTIVKNSDLLLLKQREPSRSISLLSTSEVVTTINQIYEEANTAIEAHNQMVANFTKEQKVLIGQVWKYILEKDLKDAIAAYEASKTALNKAIAGLSDQIARIDTECASKADELKQLQKQVTSIQPTVDRMNSLLHSFGFQGFSVGIAADGVSYQLRRPDGSDAKANLSEGEKTFVSFLYFYFSLKGSTSESGVTSDRIVVIDDPVSSLDSEVLFIVSSLIQDLFDEIRGGSGHIKQIFILTHNVYFHKEITFNPKRPKDGALTEESFWVVRKPDLLSKIDRAPTNPVKSSYDLLWEEIKNPDPARLSIQNTMRRIIEHYFKLTGGWDNRAIIAKFEGRDQIICKALFSWLNDGSHSAQDELYLTTEERSVQTNLSMFKRIFEETGHSSHYQMMMGEAT